MKWILPITIACLAVLTMGPPRRVKAQVNPTPPRRAGTLDLRANGKGQISQSIQDTSQTHCDTLFNIWYADNLASLWKQSYDTLRLFMEQCPFYPNSPEGFVYILDDFGGVQALGEGTWPDFLVWLKKVLYLNPDSLWYCNDVVDMVSDLEQQKNWAAAASALNYVLTNDKCTYLGLQQNYKSAIAGMRGAWFDSARTRALQYGSQNTLLYDDTMYADTTAHPFDSTPPSLYAVDLQLLMGPQFAGVQPSQPITGQALLSAQLLDNPMNSEIDIAFEMGRTALVTMQLSDVLGRTVPLTYAKYQLEQASQHDASIPAPNLPPGTYYLRITTDVGDAITLKVVKE